MKLPKKEEDLFKVEEEVHGREEAEHHHHEHEHMHGHGAPEYQAPEDINVLLLNAIAHSLNHIQGDIMGINNTLNSLKEEFRRLSNSLNTMAKIMLLREVKNEELRKKLLADIIAELS